LGDEIMIKNDLMTVPEEAIKDIEIIATVVGGRMVYEKDANLL
jgi:predicted amidohydrolase YtcJ